MIEGSSKIFEFSSVEFDAQSLLATLNYRCGDHEFSETIQFSTSIIPVGINSAMLDHALKLLHLTAGVSYYKAFVKSIDRIDVTYPLPEEIAQYLNHIYTEGLGEFFYVNNLEPKLPASFIGEGEAKALQDVAVSGYAVGLGGGKDSLVAVELLKKIGVRPVETYGINAGPLLATQAQKLETRHSQISRSVDTPSLKQLKTSDGSNVPNGHIPISAILGSIGLVQAVLNGLAKVVVAVERSADEPTHYDYFGKSVNHQYSKSSDFEKSFNLVIQQWISKKMGFFSILRPLRELDIMRLFYLLHIDEKLQGNFTSCNRSIAFTSGIRTEELWCRECDKCAFIFLLMTGADHYDEAIKTFGFDLLAKPELRKTYDALLGLTGSKPFDCVGEINECRESMDIAKQYSKAARNFSYPAPSKSVVWCEDNYLPSEIEPELKKLVTQILLGQNE